MADETITQVWVSAEDSPLQTCSPEKGEQRCPNPNRQWRKERRSLWTEKTHREFRAQRKQRKRILHWFSLNFQFSAGRRALTCEVFSRASELKTPSDQVNQVLIHAPTSTLPREPQTTDGEVQISSSSLRPCETMRLNESDNLGGMLCRVWVNIMTATSAEAAFS